MDKALIGRGYPDLEAADGALYHDYHPRFYRDYHPIVYRDYDLDPIVSTFPERLVVPFVAVHIYSFVFFLLCDLFNPAYGFLQLNWAGLLLGLYMFLGCFPFIWICMTYIWTKRGNSFGFKILGTYAAGSLLFGCALLKGRSELKAAIALALVLFCVMQYTFLPQRRGSFHEYRVLGCIVFAAVMVIVVLLLIQIVFPVPEVHPPRVIPPILWRCYSIYLKWFGKFP